MSKDTIILIVAFGFGLFVISMICVGPFIGPDIVASIH
jgi:hypothetical protein